jgi:DNA repair protein RecN (Recombination protein N)
MLRELSVTNLALIEDVRVELRPGFCAWTGETGAGKSLLLGAVGLLLGDRGSADLIRANADELRVSGVFEITHPSIRQHIERITDNEYADGQIILARRLNRAGRSVAYVNEQPVSIGTLRQIGEALVDVHGQRESHSLLQPAYQLDLLDAFGKLGPLRERYTELADAMRELRRRHRELSEKQQVRQRELSLLRFEREELDAAELRPGELKELEQERDRLMHAQSLQAFTARCAARLHDEEGAVGETLGRLLREAHPWEAIDPRIADVAKRLDTLLPEVRDLADTCRDLSEQFEADPARLDEVEKRLQLLRRLEAKYRKNVDELIEYRSTLDVHEKELEKDEEDLAGIDAALAGAFARLQDAASELSKGRAKVARKLAKETEKHLSQLGMPSAKVDAKLEPVSLGENPLSAETPIAGADHLDLLLAANPGEPARPLRKIASGGELSRTMLALKTVLAEHDPRVTLVFDEIDANVGGRLGDVLGEKLADLGRTHQVICVTHLPQVASYARCQWTIRKNTRGKRTATTISFLENEQERLEELAAMLRGEAKGETTLKEAAAMLKAAKKKWGA